MEVQDDIVGGAGRIRSLWVCVNTNHPNQNYLCLLVLWAIELNFIYNHNIILVIRSGFALFIIVYFNLKVCYINMCFLL